MIRIEEATSGDTALERYALISACVSCACVEVATFPVPIAHTGSYAITTLLNEAVPKINPYGKIAIGNRLPHLQSNSFNISTTAWSCSSQTSVVLPASRCSSVSPMQRITLRVAPRAARVFNATSRDVSWKRVRRSEWPSMGEV